MRSVPSRASSPRRRESSIIYASSVTGAHGRRRPPGRRQVWRDNEEAFADRYVDEKETRRKIKLTDWVFSDKSKIFCIILFFFFFSFILGGGAEFVVENKFFCQRISNEIFYCIPFFFLRKCITSTNQGRRWRTRCRQVEFAWNHI